MSLGSAKADVVILGAGLAGMTAAYHLRDRDIVVLESRDRVGGRTLSGDHGPYWYNLGAQFVWDKRTIELCRALRLEVMAAEDAKSAVFVNGRLAVGRDPARLFMKMPISWRDKASFAFTIARLRRLASAMHGLDPKLDAKSLGDVIGRAAPVTRAILDMATTSGTGLTADEGSGAVGRVMLECKVESVRSAADHVAVRYRRNGGAVEEVQAAACIAAMPADSAVEAIPDLPASKRSALEQMLPYAQIVSVAWLTDETEPMPWDRLLAVPVIGLSFELLSNNAFFTRHPDGPRRQGGTLVTLATGARGEALSALDDAAVVDRLRSDLLKMFPAEHEVLQRATTRIQRWRGLPRFRKGWLERQKTIREPFGRIHFCGDYTAQPGTPGAVGSGYHAAAAVRGLLD